MGERCGLPVEKYSGTGNSLMKFSSSFSTVWAGVTLLAVLTPHAQCEESNLPQPTFGEPGNYPIPMSFRRASMGSLDEILYQGQIVNGTATREYREQEKVALEFKKRRPGARVLVQYFWDAFPRAIPLQIASNSKNRFLDDRDYYPFPEFNGFYLRACPRSSII